MIHYLKNRKEKNMQDESEIRDDYCRERFGHSNWGYLSTYTKKELANKDEYVLQGGIVYWLNDFDEEDE